jgi:rRNA-processing protein CGR1
MAKTGKKNVENEENSSENVSKKSKMLEKEDIPRGKPKSGRFWKNEKKKFSSVIKTRGIRSSFEKKQALRQELKRIKEASRATLAEKEEQKEQKKQRRRDNLKRQEENRKKSEVVQVITNTKKIKNMKKKQLRYIEKRDTLNL